MTWLVDTLVWTGSLIALVLVARRPVARHFGARTAYALWMLPLVRLVLPPVVLPASLAPVSAVPSAEVIGPVRLSESVVYTANYPVAGASEPFSWVPVLLVIWLAGAAAYVAIRLLAYARLRRRLLAGATIVGHDGGVRLIETAEVTSPVALGIADKIVALPPGFMARPDRAARDLALAHELAHHRAHDLLANFAALPLFAMHWFNPLSWLGWNAMRRDQEAACDARVVEHRDRAQRALYASVIAQAAAAQHRGLSAALAAPMACPVLGGKSIIHRLRSLTMTDLSTRRRRAGHLLLGAAALALPLTASVSYAQEDVPTPPAPPAPPSAVALPAPPEPPEAPLPADAPLPPVPAGAHRIVIEEESADGSKKQRQVIVMRSTDAADDGAATQAPVRIERRVIRRGADGKVVEPDSAEFEAHMKKFEKEMERFGERMEKSIVIDERRVAQATARAAVHAEAAARSADLAAIAIARAPRVIDDCSGTERVRETSSADGKRVIRICQSRTNAQALAGIRQARNSIARNRHLPADTRAEVLKELDEEIADLESGK